MGNICLREAHIDTGLENIGQAHSNTVFSSFTVSPCKRHPDTGELCPLAGANKLNAYCKDCAYIGNGEKIRWTANELQFAFDEKRIQEHERECTFPGCTRMAKGTHKYCWRCDHIVRNRTNYYMRRNDGKKPPLSYLHMPKQGRRGRKSKKEILKASV